MPPKLLVAWLGHLADLLAEDLSLRHGCLRLAGLADYLFHALTALELISGGHFGCCPPPTCRAGGRRPQSPTNRFLTTGGPRIATALSGWLPTAELFGWRGLLRELLSSLRSRAHVVPSHMTGPHFQNLLAVGILLF